MVGERMFNVGETHITFGGQLVMIEEYSNEGTSYETVLGSDGKHRYNRRDYGRCTGTDYEVPSLSNLEIPAELRHLATFIPNKSNRSLQRAKNCSCGSDFLMLDRTPFNDIVVRCLTCGNKSMPDSLACNATNYWNKGEYDES